MYTYKYGHRTCCPIDEGVWSDPEPLEVGSRRGQIQQVLVPQILFFQILSLSGWRFNSVHDFLRLDGAGCLIVIRQSFVLLIQY